LPQVAKKPSPIWAGVAKGGGGAKPNPIKPNLDYQPRLLA